jgi:hypothetical protein
MNVSDPNIDFSPTGSARSGNDHRILTGVSFGEGGGDTVTRVMTNCLAAQGG